MHLRGELLPDEAPDPIDIVVGGRIRLGREIAGISRPELAVAIGITRQQLQKYEEGVNRIAASMLHKAACTLKVPISWFFQGLSEAEVDASAIMVDTKRLTTFAAIPESLDLAGIFITLSPARQKVVLELVKDVESARGVRRGRGRPRKARSDHLDFGKGSNLTLPNQPVAGTPEPSR